MGKALSTNNDFGHINIQFDKAKYTSGEQVNGMVHVNMIKSFPSNSLYLIISGKEKVKLATSETKMDASNEHKTETVIHKDKNEFFSHSFPLYIFNGMYFQAGMYSFPFSFKLFDNLPGTYIDTWDELGQKCYAKTVYKVWAGLKDQRSSTAFFTKQYFKYSTKRTK